MKRRGIGILLGLGLLMAALPVWAQTSTWVNYSWQSGNMVLRYPAAWQEPAATDTESRQTLTLSPTASPAPEDAQITLALIPISAETPDAATLLTSELEVLGLTPTLTLPDTWLEGAGFQAYAVSADGQFMGRGRIGLLPGNYLLVMVGRAVAAEHAAFDTLFSTISASVTLGAQSILPAPAYGALWLTQSTPMDGPNALAALAGLTLGQDGKLYLVDSRAGLVIVDAATGTLLETHPFRTPTRISAMALGSDGSVYAADVQCQCIQKWQAGEWRTLSQGYAVDAPRSLAVGADNTLYATDTQDGRAYVRAIRADGESRLQFESPQLNQPLLAADAAGQVFALTDGGELWQVEGVGFSLRYTLQLVLTAPRFNAFSFTPDGQLLLVTAQDGIVQYAETGVESGRIGQGNGQGLPPPDVFVNPVGAALNPAGTLFVADNANGITRIIALSSDVLAGRSGAVNLRSGAVVGGTLTPVQRYQVWTLDVAEPAVYDFAAVSQLGTGLDVALRIYDPTGAEIAYKDNFEPIIPEPNAPPIMQEMRLLNPQDPALEQVELPDAGVYYVVVEQGQGGGNYQLGVQEQLTFAPTTDAPAEVRGMLGEALPVQHSVFEARAGQTVTITLTALDGTLDPTLILRDPNGVEIARNEDAADPTLLMSAQIPALRLDANGTYTIDAARFGGAGRYVLTIKVE